MEFLYFQFVRTYAHPLHGTFASVRFKRFVHGGIVRLAHEGAKPQQRRQSVGLVGRVEFQHRAVLVAHTERCDALATVAVESPHRLSILPGNAGKKARERPGLVVSGRVEAVALKDAVGGHWNLEFRSAGLGRWRCSGAAGQQIVLMRPLLGQGVIPIPVGQHPGDAYAQTRSSVLRPRAAGAGRQSCMTFLG